MIDRPREERLAEILRRLEALPLAGSGADALRQIAQVVNEVEDEMTTIPADPTTRGSDGRMYPPEDDARRDVADRPDVHRYRTRGHNVYVRDNGAIELREVKNDHLVFEKAGRDGRKVLDP